MNVHSYIHFSIILWYISLANVTLVNKWDPISVELQITIKSGTSNQSLSTICAQVNQNTRFFKIDVVFSKFYGKVGVISWFLFHIIWKNYVLHWDFDLKSWIVDFFTRFTREKTPQNNFSSQNFSVENNYFHIHSTLTA